MLLIISPQARKADVIGRGHEARKGLLRQRAATRRYQRSIIPSYLQAGQWSSDASEFLLIGQVIQHIIDWYRPGAIVLQMGADSLAGDKLGGFNVTLEGRSKQPALQIGADEQDTPSVLVSSKASACQP